jgi:hypothetical protein
LRGIGILAARFIRYGFGHCAGGGGTINHGLVAPSQRDDERVSASAETDAAAQQRIGDIQHLFEGVAVNGHVHVS